MVKLYLVRHGQAAAGIGESIDPGLDNLGQRQAVNAAEQLGRLPAMPLFSSPLLRARQTALPLAQRWQADVTIEARMAEIPFPSDDLEKRSRWLQSVMPGTWSALDEYWQSWRRSVIACLLEQRQDCVFFSHFIAINVTVGSASNDDRMVVFRPDNASITRLLIRDGALHVDALGGEAVTRVN